MFLRSAMVAVAIGGAVALPACGSDDKKSESGEGEEAQVSPAQAITEIAAVRRALNQAVGELKDGDKSAADNTVSEAYLQHFEKVEGPLGERDHELNEELEESISQELRDKIKKESPADVEAFMADIDRDLTAAEAKLK
jgi:hypothetical protein